MTLRVRLSIVPFGDETQEREIHQVNISNVGVVDSDTRYLRCQNRYVQDSICTYGIEIDTYKTHRYHAYTDHKRSDGPLELVYKALGAYLDDKE